MASINLSMHYDFFNTTLPNAFVDNYMLNANHTYVVIYIYVYRQCLSGRVELSTSDIAKAMNILESDVINALKYWEKLGLVNINLDSKKDLKVEFLQIPQGGRVQTPTPIQEPESNIVFFPEKQQPEVSEVLPKYTVKELELYKSSSKEVETLFSIGEQSLGRLLTYEDLNILFGLYDWLRLPFEVIQRLLEYCAEKDHRNIHYIEKVAIDWAEKGISTLEAAQEYIDRFNNTYRQILKAFGHTNRNATKSEIKYMEKWLNEYSLSLELIFEACDKTIMQIGQPKFSYADKILTKWYLNKVSTLEEVAKLDDDFYKEAAKVKEEKKATKQTKTAKNRFVNFEQRNIDYEKLEKLEKALLTAEE